VILLLVSGTLSLNLQHELFLSMYPPHFSNVRCYSNRIDIGPDMILTQHLDPNDPLSDTYSFVLANRYLLHRSYIQAEKLYSELLSRKPDDPYIMNNLGCLYYYQQRIAEAIVEWSKAIDVKPNLAVAYLNRSLGKNKQFDFEGAKEDQDKCRSLDPVLYQRFTETQMDEVMPTPYYPSLESTKIMAVEQFKHFNKSLQGPLKPTQSRIALVYRPAFSLGTIILFGIALFVLITKKREKFARACYKCGRAYCSHCKTSLEFESFCGQCVHLYIKQDGVSPQDRMQKNYEVEVFNKKGKIIRAILALLSPGAGHIWEGHIYSGFVILLLWNAFLSGFVSRIFAYPMPFVVVGGASNSAYNFIATVFMIVLWLLFGLAKALSRQTANISLLRR
ncbi:MAG: tetratricopeptide repeat protein, partial [Acidobacteria bacterium]|nr:tetratricopeptide repeat protein [Acidobacteriota bacterium]